MNQLIDSNLVLKQGFFKRLKEKFHRYKVTFSLGLALVLILFSLAAVFINFTLNSRNPYKDLNYQENQTLHIISTNPSTGTEAMPDKITVTFSDPVDAHAFEHYFVISPQTDGSFSASNNGKEINFKPEKSFQRGVSFSFKILSGLTSKNNKPLLADYIGSFSTRLADNEVKFIKDNVSGKVLSFSGKAEIKLNVKKASNLGAVKANIYESNKDKLLAFLTYKSEKLKYSDGYSYSIDSYINLTLPHKDLKEIKSFDINESSSEISLNLAPGIYYIEASDFSQKAVGGTFIIVNKTGLIARQDDQKLVLSTFDLNSGLSINDEVKVTLYSSENQAASLGDYIVSSVRSISFPFDKRLDFILAQKGGETIFVPIKLPQSQADLKSNTDLEKAAKILIYTDRPVYQLKDKVYFRGVVRQDSDALYKVFANKPIRVWINPKAGEKPIVDKVVTTDEHGVFSGEFTIPEDTKISDQYSYENTHYLNVSTNLEKKEGYYNTSSANAFFDVIKYSKPDFELKSNISKEEIIKGEKITFDVSGRYFNGSPLTDEVKYTLFSQNYYETEKAIYNKNFNITVQGGMCGGGFGTGDEYYGEKIKGGEGTLTLDKNGFGVVVFDTSNLKNYLSQKITLVVEKQDNSNNKIVSASNVLVHASSSNLFFLPSATRYKAGEEIVAPFYIENLDGSKVAKTDLDFRLIEETYDSTSSQSKENVFKNGKVQTDENGKGVVKLTLESSQANKSLYLVASITDSSGRKTEGRKNIYVTDDKDPLKSSYFWKSGIDQTYLKIRTSQNSYKVSDTINFTINSPKEIDALMSLERGRVYLPTIVHLKAGENQLPISVTSELSPSITVVFSFFADGQYHSEGLELNVPAMHQLLQVTLTPDKQKYSPTDTAQLRIATKDASGNGVSAQLSLDVVDKAIYALKKSATPAVHSTFYAKRGRSTNASSSLTQVGTYQFGGGGGGGGGVGTDGKPIDTLYWNPNLTTDSDGNTAVSIPLKGAITTWKASAVASTDDSKFGQGDLDFLVAP